MENPGLWNLLVSSLAACDLEQTEKAWEFLVLQGLVRETPVDRVAFCRFVREEIDRGPITGPSVAMRVSLALQNAGIALPAGNVPDPWGEIAQQRLLKHNRPS